MPDLHGSIAGSLASDEAKLTHALRYDAYGQTIDTGSAAGAPSPVGEKPWRYQGRLDVSPIAGSPLYDMSARFYAPAIAAFTSLDTVAGSAQHPLSMNRFLYAEANPATLIDPTGHAAVSQSQVCGPMADICGDTSTGNPNGGSQNQHVHTDGAPACSPNCAAKVTKTNVPASTPHVPSLKTGYNPDWQPGVNPVPWNARILWRDCTEGSVAACNLHYDPQSWLGPAQCGSVACLPLMFGGAGLMSAAVAWAGATTASALVSGGQALLGGAVSILNAIRERIGAGASPGWGPVKPVVKDPDLQRSIVDQIYRPGAQIGNGGTADAIRAGAGHIDKGAERIAQMIRWLEQHPDADPHDIHVVQTMLTDMISAMAGQPFPGK